MASNDRFENRCEFLPQLKPVVKSSPGTSFIHAEQGRKKKIKAGPRTDISKQHIAAVPVQTGISSQVSF